VNFFAGIGDAHEIETPRARRDAVAAGGVMPAVIFGLDADACEAEERRGNARDGRVVLPRNQQNGILGGADFGNRRRWGAHDVENVFWWEVVAGGSVGDGGFGRAASRSCLRGDGERGGGGKERCEQKYFLNFRDGHVLLRVDG
jgi:hypothetical protein